MNAFASHIHQGVTEALDGRDPLEDLSKGRNWCNDADSLGEIDCFRVNIAVHGLGWAVS